MHDDADVSRLMAEQLAATKDLAAAVRENTAEQRLTREALRNGHRGGLAGRVSPHLRSTTDWHGSHAAHLVQCRQHDAQVMTAVPSGLRADTRAFHTPTDLACAFYRLQAAPSTTPPGLQVLPPTLLT